MGPARLGIGQTWGRSDVGPVRHGAGRSSSKNCKAHAPASMDPPAALPSDIARSAPAIISGLVGEHGRTSFRRVAAADIFC